MFNLTGEKRLKLYIYLRKCFENIREQLESLLNVSLDFQLFLNQIYNLMIC